jgi:hypothetical protein
MTTKIAAIPPLDGVKDPAIKRVLQSIKDMLEIRDGQRKSQDGLDRYVTLREFADAAQSSGIGSAYRAGAGGGFSLGGLFGQINNGLYDKPDLSRPPTLSVLEADATMTTVALRWDSWTSDLRHGLTEVWRASVDDIGQAVLVGTAPGDIYFDGVGEPGRTYYYWIRAISRWEGAPPGFFNATRGTAVTTTIDPAQLMPYLVDSINESHLVGALRTRFDLIDGADPNSIASRLLAESEARVGAIAAETAARVAAINAERDSRVQALAQEAMDRGAAISIETTARQSADESLASQINTLTSAVDDNAAAIQTESTARADADAALAEQIAVVAATSDAVRSATAAMVVQEARARADSDTAFAQQITTLSAAVEDNAAAIQTESTTRASQYDALAEQITLVSAGVGEQFDFKQIWYFDDGVDGWAGNGAPTVSAGWLRPANHATDPYVESPTGLAVAANQHNQIRARIRRHGTPAWAGRLWWKRTTDSTWDASRSITLDEPVYDANGIGLISASVAWSDTIHQVRLALSTGQDATHYFTLDWFAVGRPSPGASTAALVNEATARATADTALTNQLNSLASTVTGNYGTLSADITSEATTRANEDEAISRAVDLVAATAESVRAATAALAVSETIARASEDEAFVSRVDTIQTTVDGNTAAIQTQATAINGLSAQYTIKLRAGGAIAGIGLAASDDGEGGVTSEVAIVSDKFYIAPPNSESKGSRVFAHYATPTTINGQSVPAGTYIESAYIPYGVINKLHFDKATGNKIIAADATFGDVLADTIKVVNANIVGEIKSDNFVTGSTGWRIHKNGVAEFSNAIVRGTVYATNGEFYGTLKGGAATSYTAGTGLWAGDYGGTYALRLGSTSSYMRWTGAAIELRGTITITDASGNVLLSSGTGVPWDRISGKTGLAAVSQITASNASTYIANAAIGAAQIGSINLVGTSNFAVKTAASGARMDMDSRRIKVFDASGVLRVQLGDLTA